MADISPEHFARELTQSLTEYGRLAQREMRSILESVGEEAVAMVADLSPKGHRRGSGKYKRGWKLKLEEKGGAVRVTVYNKRYQLTHLLENGHRTRLKHGRYGKRTVAGAQPHIGAVNEWAQRELEQRIRQALGGG